MMVLTVWLIFISYEKSAKPVKAHLVNKEVESQ